MKTVSKLISLVLSLSMIFACLPQVSFADEQIGEIAAADEQLQLETPKRGIVWNKTAIAVSDNFLVGLYTNGNAFSVLSGASDFSKCYATSEFEGEIAKTNKIVDIAIPKNEKFVAGLREDGTVYVTTPLTNNGQNAVSDWTDIVQISAGNYHVVGLKEDGTVVATAPSKTYDYGQSDVSAWTDIVKVAAGTYCTAGLKKDGTVVVTEVKNQQYAFSHSDAASWTDIVDICTSDTFTAGVKKDGTVVATATDQNYTYEAVKNWTDIQSISAYSTRNSTGYMLGLKKDGTVLITDNNSPFTADIAVNNELKETIKNWTDIKNVYAANTYTVAVKNNGDVVFAATGSTVQKNLESAKLNEYNLESTVIPKPVFSYTDDGCYMDFETDYTGGTPEDPYNYLLYYADETQNINPYDAENTDNNLYTDSVPITAETTFDVVLVKQSTEDTSLMYPSNVLKVTAYAKSENNGGFLPEISTGVESGVCAPDTESISLDFTATFGGETLSCYDLYYRDKTKENETFILYDKVPVQRKTKEYSEVEFEAYAVLKGTETKTETKDFKYVFLNEMPNKYPIAQYETELTKEESDKLNNNILIPKKNIIKAAAGDSMSLVLNTNGTVSGAFNQNIDSAYSKKAIVGPKSYFTNSKVSNASAKYSSGSIANFTADDWSCVGNWRMISDIAVGNDHVIGLKLDGTVVSAGINDNTDNDHGQLATETWTNIVDVAAGSYHSIGLKEDGSVVAVGLNVSGQCDLDTWIPENPTDGDKIVAVAASNNYSLGLKRNGTVVSAGDNSHGQTNVGDWENIIDIAAGTQTSAGLKNDGTVVVAGKDAEKFKTVTDTWKNVVAIDVGTQYVLALTYDGQILHAGTDSKGNNLGAVYYYDTEKNKMMSIGENVDFSSGKNCYDIFNYLDLMYKLGEKFIAVAAGDNHIIAITENGVPYSIIHGAYQVSAGKNLSDTKYPLIAEFSVLNGPTVINNYASNTYNYDLDISLTGINGYDIIYTTDDSDPKNQGKKYTGAFEMTTPYLKLYLEKIDSTTSEINSNYDTIYYYYHFSAPDIKAVPEAGSQTGPVEVALRSTINSYKIYYTTDGTIPTNKSEEYTSPIALDKSTLLKAVAYSADGKTYTPVYDMYYSIPTDGQSDGKGTYISYDRIQSGADIVWTASESPYILQSGLTIPSGSTLYIDPGVEVRMPKSKVITVNGSIYMAGTEDKPIKFVSSTADKWSGIKLGSATGNTENCIKYVQISNSTDGINITTEKANMIDDIVGVKFSENTTALTLSNVSGYTVKDSVFEDNTTAVNITTSATENIIDGCTFDKNDTAVAINGNANKIINSVIKNSTAVGVHNISAAGTIVNNCKFIGNLVSVKAVSDKQADYSLDFTKNYWGNATLGIIKNRIIDSNTNGNYPYVDISDFIIPENTYANAKCEIDSAISAIYQNDSQALLTLENVMQAKCAMLTAAKFEGENQLDMIFAAAVYDSNGKLIRFAAQPKVLQANISTEDVILSFCEADETAKPAKIKIMAWDSKTFSPYTKTIVIE